MQITCCRGCADRCAEPNCHITCERYIEACKRLDEERKARYLANEPTSYSFDIAARFDRFKHHRHKSKKR